MASNNIEGRQEEQFNQAFGEHTGISEEGREDIENIKNNDVNVDVLSMWSSDTERFTNQAWRLLGRYIANNTHLKRFDLDERNITDDIMTSLFSELTSSVSLERFDLDCNDFGIEGVKSIVPFLQNCPNFSILYLDCNRNINSECFEILVRALDEKFVKELHFDSCNITDISALDRHNLPRLKQLILNGNNIGKEGCRTLSNLLQQEGSTLTELYLINSGINDEGAEIIASSLKHNTKLETLRLRENSNITNEAYVVFLKLLVDMSSINSVYSSNHTILRCDLNGDDDTYNDEQALISRACGDNTRTSVGRVKVIKYQLNSQNRKKLCELQDIEYIPGSVFADIEPTLLPHILALIGSEHGQSELYTTLIHTAPDLLSYIDRKAMLDEAMAKNTARVASLSEECAQKVAEHEQKIAALKADLLSETSRLAAENNDLKNRRALIDVGDSRQSATGEGEGCGGISRGKKRGRS